MNTKNSAETLISTYRSAERDADELLSYLEKIRSVDEIIEGKIPMLVTELQNKDSAKSQAYVACAAITGGGVATAIGTTLACGALTKGAAYGLSATTVALASSFGVRAGIGALIPGVGILALPIASIPVLLKLISDGKVKKYIKDNKDKLQKKKQKIKEYCKRVQGFIDETQKSIEEINKRLKEELSIKIKEYQEKAKLLAKEVSIQIDDLVNVNANERIQKYNEIILKQYRLQKDLEERLDYLYTEYDKLLKEKADLERRMGILMQLLNTMGCPESVINQALSE